MAQKSNWKTSGRKQQKGQSNASARARQKRKQIRRTSQKLRAGQTKQRRHRAVCFCGQR